MRQLIIAALLCTFSACSCGSTPCVSGAGPGGTGGFGGAGGSGVDVTPGFVGQLDSVLLETVDSFSTCTGQPVVVTSAEAEVLDPTNTKVASTVTMPTDFSGNVQVTVAFTPATPGPYHITVRFLPNSSTVQKDVLIAVDKKTEPAHTDALPPEVTFGCEDVDVDEGQVDTVLCLTTLNAQHTLASIQNGALKARQAADSFALTESRVWVYRASDTTLHVYGLGSDGSLNELASQPVGEVVSHLLAQGDDALLLSSNGFREEHFSSDGGLAVTNDVQLSSTTYAQWVPNVGAQVYDNLDVCSFSLSSGAATPLNLLDGGFCGSYDSTGLDVVGFDDDGLWSLDNNAANTPDQITLRVTGWQGGQTRASSGSLSYGSQNQPAPLNSSPHESTPVLFLGGQAGSPMDLYLPHFDGTEVTLTRYPFASNDVHADSKRLWSVSGTTLTWWPR